MGELDRSGEVVYVTVNQPTEWQQASEAVYGPFTRAQREAFCEWLATELHDTGWVRIVTFPMMPPPAAMEQESGDADES